MGEAMADPTEHVHSRAAYEMMDEFLIGQLGGSEKIVSEDWVPDPNFHPEDTDTLADFQRSKFIDLQKPLLAQVWKGGFSKEFYLEQVHQPRHVKVSARLFGSDLLEPLTRTKWWVVPMIWLPITGFLGVLSLAQFNDRYVTSRSFGSFAVVVASVHFELIPRVSPWT
jgi:4-hydroxysphinganine ceramide fatty acyl 2-hydroxylase